jgi:hypothetical protein
MQKIPPSLFQFPNSSVASQRGGNSTMNSAEQQRPRMSRCSLLHHNIFTRKNWYISKRLSRYKRRLMLDCMLVLNPSVPCYQVFVLHQHAAKNHEKNE